MGAVFCKFLDQLNSSGMFLKKWTLFAKKWNMIMTFQTTLQSQLCIWLYFKVCYVLEWYLFFVSLDIPNASWWRQKWHIHINFQVSKVAVIRFLHFFCKENIVCFATMPKSPWKKDVGTVFLYYSKILSIIGL